MKHIWCCLLAVCLGAIGLSPLSAGEVSADYAATAVDRPDLHFWVISDIHIRHEHPSSARKLKAALTDLQAAAPDADALVMNGDLTEGRPEDYRLLSQVLAEQPHPIPVLAAIGNHEFYRAWYDLSGSWNAGQFPNGETERDSLARFAAFAGTPGVYGEQIVKGYVFLFLGTERYRQTDPALREDAWLSPAQLRWLEGRLDAADRTGKPVFVFLHQPLPDPDGPCCRDGRGVVQHRELSAILSRHPQVILFSGHTHQSLKDPGAVRRSGFVRVRTSSVWQPWRVDASGNLAPLSPDESEGVYVAVDGGRVVIRGRDLLRHRWIPEASFTMALKSWE